jgi:hypothetical protein
MLTMFQGREAIEMMCVIKNAIDPKNLMNPGKIFPDNITPQSVSHGRFTVSLSHFSVTS